MLQVPVEELEIEPGYAVEWTLSFAGAIRPDDAAGTQPAGSYNQEDHFGVARTLRQADFPYSSYIGGSFEIPGALDREALEAALLHFVRRHEVLRCVFRESDGALALDVVGPQDVKLEAADVGQLGTREEARSYVQGFLRGTSTLRGPWLVMGAVIRDDSTTVYFACDHLVTDGVSTPVAVSDIATAYQAIRDGRRVMLPEAAGYLGHAGRERRRGRSMDADDARLDHWKAFTARNNGLFPPFPLDLGMHPGGRYGAVNETDTLLAAGPAAAMEAHCRAAGGRLSTGVLAAVAVSLHREGGPEVYRALLPVSTRDRGPEAHSMGWFVNTLPVEFSVAQGRGFAEVIGAAQGALADMRRSADAPFVRAYELLTAQQSGPRVWPLAVNFFSYLDFRRTPGAQHHVAWKARKYVWASHSNGIFFWFHRNDTGVHLNTIHVDTPQARRTKAGFVRTLTRTMDHIAGHGTF
ncbi:condensation domain-containing protein [Kitasatospora sp. NPDC057223]|uniref:condensation domain-containing protein n=1 Tax=Kitasatospora sp. NPDC057223 TaxID=3346055 RepID=UPI00362659DB